jgi:hypothetical protein
MELLGECIMWNLVSVCLETVLVSVQYRCTICAKRTIGSEIVLDAPDDTLGDEAQVETCLSPFGDSGNLDSTKEHGLGRTYNRLRNRFGCTRRNS